MPGWTCDAAGCSEVCGAAQIVGNETCDDGGTVPGDGCSATCAQEAGWTGTPSCSGVCGDALVVGNEACDDGDPCTIDLCILGGCNHFPDPHCT